MINFSSKYKRIILSLILIAAVSSLGIFVFGAGQAEAWWPWSVIKDAAAESLLKIPFALFTSFFAAIAFIFQIIVNLFFWFCGLLLEIAFGIEKFTDVEIVETGWGIVRNIANMFFVLILLIIAFATILRLETYGMKALLPKLIIAALLINFSLVFAGAIIDFSQVLTHFFYDEIKGEHGISFGIAKIIQIQKTEQINKEAEISTKLTQGAGGAFLAIFSMILQIVMTFCAGLALAFGAFFLIVRLIMLWFLLILSPIAWILWILPTTSRIWQQWWNAFLKWAFFAPIYAFFVYLALKTADFSKILNEESKAILSSSQWKEVLTKTIFAQSGILIQAICIIGILFGGLIAAQKLGVYGAQGAIGIAKGVGKGASKWTGQRLQMAAAPLVKKTGQALQKTWVGKTPLVRQTTRPFRAFEEKERKTMSGVEKTYSDRTSDNLKAEYKSVNSRAKAAIAKILAERGDLQADTNLNFADRDIQEATKLTKRYEQHRSVLKARPDLAPLIKESGQTNQEAINKAVSSIKPVDIEKLQTTALTSQVNQAIQEQLTLATGSFKGSHLAKMAETNPKLIVEVKQHIIDPNKGTFRPDIENYLNSDAGKAIFGEYKKRAEKEAPHTTA